jgi:hypothetical protein
MQEPEHIHALPELSRNNVSKPPEATTYVGLRVPFGLMHSKPRSYLKIVG